VVLTVDSASKEVCALSGSKVTFTGGGTCKIDANQPGNNAYEPAPEVSQSFAVAKKTQTVAITSPAPTGAVVGVGTYEVTAEAKPSGLAVVLTVDSASKEVCALSGSKVTFTGGGTCTIDANESGNSEWAGAPQTQQSFAVSKKPQTILFSAPPTSAYVGGPTYAVSATSPSEPPITLTVDLTSSSVCTLSGTTVSFIGAGTCTIDALQASNSQYEAGQAQLSFAVSSVTVVAPPSSQPRPPSPPTTKPPLVNSNFIAGTSSFEAASGRVIFIETITNGGTFSWSLTVPNGKFGVIASNKASRSAKKCRGGLVRLGGRCRRSTIVFSEGSATVPAGVVIFKLRPSATAMKMLQSAFRHKHGVLVTATFTFQSSLGGSPVTHRQVLVDKLKRK
jgi:hypothetical protein